MPSDDSQKSKANDKQTDSSILNVIFNADDASEFEEKFTNQLESSLQMIKEYSLTSPLKKMRKALTSLGKPYKHQHKKWDEFKQPVHGLSNLKKGIQVGTLSVALIPISLIFIIAIVTFKTADSFIDTFEQMIDNSIGHLKNGNYGSGLYYLALSLPAASIMAVATLVSGSIICTLVAAVLDTLLIGMSLGIAFTHSLYGASQIITTPLIPLTMAIRTLVNQFVETPLAEERGGFKAFAEASSTEAFVDSYHTSKIAKHLSNTSDVTFKTQTPEEITKEYLHYKFTHDTKNGVPTLIDQVNEAETFSNSSSAEYISMWKTAIKRSKSTQTNHGSLPENHLIKLTECRNA